MLGTSFSPAQLWHSVSTEKFRGKQISKPTFKVYFQALYEEGVFREVGNGKSKHSKYQHWKYRVSDEYYDRYMDECMEFYDILASIEKKLLRVNYGKKLPKREREQLFSKALGDAYRAYIPTHFRLLREATFGNLQADASSLGLRRSAREIEIYQIYRYRVPILCLTMDRVRQRFLEVTNNMRYQASKDEFAIANHSVWGWNQMYGMPRIVGAMWEKQKESEKQFLRDDRKFRKSSRRLSKSELSFLEELEKSDWIVSYLDQLLSDLMSKIQREPTRSEFIAELSARKVDNPEGMLRSLLSDKLLAESEGRLFLGPTAKQMRGMSQKAVRALLGL